MELLRRPDYGAEYIRLGGDGGGGEKKETPAEAERRESGRQPAIVSPGPLSAR